MIKHNIQGLMFSDNEDESKERTTMILEVPKTGIANRRSNGHKKEKKGKEKHDNEEDKTQTKESDKEGSSHSHSLIFSFISSLQFYMPLKSKIHLSSKLLKVQNGLYMDETIKT